jgi:hypothetical protein
MLSFLSSKMASTIGCINTAARAVSLQKIRAHWHCRVVQRGGDRSGYVKALSQCYRTPRKARGAKLGEMPPRRRGVVSKLRGCEAHRDRRRAAQLLSF